MKSFHFTGWKMLPSIENSPFQIILHGKIIYTYRKVASSNTCCLEAHAGFYRLLMKGFFDPYVL